MSIISKIENDSNDSLEIQLEKFKLRVAEFLKTEQFKLMHESGEIKLLDEFEPKSKREFILSVAKRQIIERDKSKAIRVSYVLPYTHNHF